MNPASPRRPAGIAFGRFQVWPDRRDLLADGQPLRLGGRAFDVLLALLEARGAVVSREALKARVWPNQTVEDNNLAAQIVALRKALGEERGLIRTVAGRGYQFTGETRALPAAAEASEVATSPAAEPIQAPTNLPEQVTELIGREQELAEVLALLASSRLVTLTGPGGIGKTRLALAAARQLLPDFADGVWIAEFSAIADPGLVASTVAAAVGLQPGVGVTSPQLVAQALGHRRLLLILDTCEHVIDAGAAMAEALLQAGSGVRILATSREPLRVEGEHIYPVPPLALPAPEAEDPWRFGAVRLFAARSGAWGVQVSDDQRVAAAIAGICRQLDGIPLAIELAAARAATLGIEGLGAHLADRFGLLTGGRRTAMPRHQTLRATLDWSYDLLSEAERVFLRRLAVFAGAFSAEAVSAVAANAAPTTLEVVDGLSNLITKSLLAAEVKGPVARYRLLDTMRAYALEKLKASGEHERLLRHHAEYYQHLFERAEVESETRPTVEWFDDYGWCIDNLRAALDWAFSPEGDASVGVALTAAAARLWVNLSLLDECRSRVEQALAVYNMGEPGDPRLEWKLYSGLAISSLWGSVGRQHQVAGREWAMVWERRLAIAESHGDTEAQLRALWALFSFHMAGEQYHVALETAQRLRTLAAQHQGRRDELSGERLMGLAQYFLGDQISARQHTEYMLANFITSDPISRGAAIHASLNQRVAARIVLAPILWLQGFPDQAIRTAKHAVDEARELNQATTLSRALARAACPIMLWVGDLAAAEHYIAMLLDDATRLALRFWAIKGRNFQRVLEIMRGDSGHGLSQLRADLDEFVAMSDGIFLNELAAGFARAGRVAEGLATAEQALEQAEHTGARWLFPESLRIRGELLLLQAEAGAPVSAEDHFVKRLTGHNGKVRCPGNCAPLRVLRDCCGFRAARPTQRRCFSQSMTGSRKGSRPQT